MRLFYFFEVVTDHGKDIQDFGVKIKSTRQMRHPHYSITIYDLLSRWRR